MEFHDLNIQIAGGVFKSAVTGHSSDGMNASLRVNGLSRATLKLPIVNGVIWHARVYYEADADTWKTIDVMPAVGHQEDEEGVSFHTLDRAVHADVLIAYDVIEPPVDPFPVPENFHVSADDPLSIDVVWDPVEGAEFYEVAYQPAGLKVETANHYHTLAVGAGEWNVSIRVKATEEIPASAWATPVTVTVVEEKPPVEEGPEPALVDLVVGMKQVLDAWCIKHDVTVAYTDQTFTL